MLGESVLYALLLFCIVIAVLGIFSLIIMLFKFTADKLDAKRRVK